MVDAGRKELVREMKEEERRERKVLVCDVLLCDPPHIDMFAYTLWLHGYSAIEGTAKKHSLSPFQSPQDMRTYKRHLLDQYYNFSIIDRFLKFPPRLSSQTAFAIDIHTADGLLKKYYQIDWRLVAFVFPRKCKFQYSLLEELAKQGKQRVSPVKRTFKNLRRIHYFAESSISSDGPSSSSSSSSSSSAASPSSPSLSQLIQNEFRLPLSLAQQYVRYCFLAHYQFSLITRKVAYITHKDAESLAALLIREWTAEYVPSGSNVTVTTVYPNIGSSSGSGSLSASMSGEKEREKERGGGGGGGILWDGKMSVLRDMRSVLTANQSTSLKSHVLKLLKAERSLFSSEAQMADIEGKLGPILKGILLYTTVLWSEKEMRTFFTEFLDRIPLKALRLTPPQFEFFFKAIMEAMETMFCGHAMKKEYVRAGQRFLNGIQGCAAILLAAQSRQIKL